MSNLRSLPKNPRSPQKTAGSPESPSNPRSPRSDLTFCAEAPRAQHFALFVDGQQLATAKDREAALAKAKAGELTRLEIEAVTFLQTKTPNRNFVRFKPGMMPSFAKSFAGQPFLRDHASRDMLARGGTILSSKLEHLDPEDGDGESDTGKDKQIRMRIELVKAWAIEAALDGTLDRFSIGWSRTGAIECSACKASISKCYHWPGDELDDGQRVEFIFTAADGTEVSGVNVPAVVGTGIEAISLHAIDRSDSVCTLVVTPDIEPETNEESNAMNKLAMLCTILAISATSTEDDAIRAVEKLRDERDEALESRDEAKLALEVASKAATDKLATERKSMAKAKLDELKKRGLLKAGTSKREERLTRLAERDFEDFLAQCDEMLEGNVRVTAVGAPILATTPPVTEHPGDDLLAERPHLAENLRKLGVTREQYEKHGANARTRLAEREAAGWNRR